MALEQIASQQKSFTDRLKERKDVANQYKQAYLKQLQEAGQSDYKIGTTSMFGSLGPMQKALTGIVESAGEDVSGTGLSFEKLLDYQLKGLDKGYELEKDESGNLTGQWVPIDSGEIGIDTEELSEGVKKELSKNMDGVKKFTGAIKDLQGISDWESKTRGITGPLSGLFKLAKPESSKITRNRVGEIADSIRNDIFGAQVTDLEKKIGTIPGKLKSEAENRRVIEQYLENTINSIQSRLKNEGYSQAQIDGYLQDQLGEDIYADVQTILGNRQSGQEKVSESGFDREAAKAAGYTDEEIDNYLQNQ